MGVSYTSALERDGRRAASAARNMGAGHALLPLTSLVAMLAIGLAYGGRTQTSGRAASAQRPAVVTNLNTVSDSSVLEHALESSFGNLSDRRFAARGLLAFLLAARNGASEMPNVGAILGATTTPDAIERVPGLVTYADRLRRARERAATIGAPPPRTIPLFTSDDLSLLKPSFVVRTPSVFARRTLIWAAAYLVGFYAVALLWWMRGVRGDVAMLVAAHLLTTIGFAVLLSRPDPLRDSVLFVRYAQGVLLGLGVMAALAFVDVQKAAFLTLSYIPLAGALSLSALLILFGHGPGASNAKVNLGPVQPIEAIRLLLALFLAGYFARRWELLRQIRGERIRHYRVPAWLNLPRGDYVLPVVTAVAAALVFFFLQKDLGPALFLSCVFLAMYAVARGRITLAAAGLALLVAGFYLGYRLNVSATLAERVRMWQSPWDNAARGGDQIAQAIWALSTGGLFGTGLGFGDTRYLPAGHTDLVLAAVGEELGLVGLLIVAASYAVNAIRGFRVALAAASDYGFFLATAVTLFLVVPVLTMAAGVLGFTPLTGVVTPFLSYGGSAMAANFAGLGILTAIDAHRGSPDAARPFEMPMRYLRGALAVAALGLIAGTVNVQVLRADEYVVKPHLGIQADGVRRFQYNQRVLDIIRDIPRGNVYDRQGLPLATGDRATALRARDEYARLGVTPNGTCADPIERCYPLAGAAFHLLGDAPTRLNWSATNTSYIERDADDRLRGFDDRAIAVQSSTPGPPTQAIRRDYRELVPLLRHRYNPGHPDAAAVLARNRDVKLTIDARLQLRVAAILSAYAQKSAGGRAAAVVVDANTGDLLAVASYPFPVLARYRNGDAVDGPDALLDRARYGLYPPGSTFKLVTAAAALRRDINLSGTTFTCSRLPDGRVGAQLPGWTRPVRDDVLDTHPHGTIDMHDGLVHSCNAYFAQLAQRVGPEAILDTAARLGISVAAGNSVQRLRATLPQAGYGQGDVIATPLRMARVAAALASHGVLRETRWEARSNAPGNGDVLLPPAAADLLARDMRDAVLSGTGRSLSTHPSRIAGKTGTAEIGGSPSHAWFVGFAPYGAATKRIAFAIILERAGYGGRAAAPVAGEIVTAAAAAGLVR